MFTRDLTIPKDILDKTMTIKPHDDFDFIVLSFIKYYRELQNALEVLLGAKNSVGMTYILRGQYEIFLQFSYLMEHFDDDFDLCTQRAQSYVFFHWMSNLQWYTHLNDNENINLMNQKIMSCPDIEDAYKTAKKRQSHPHWFSLYGGPTSFNKLEEHLKFNDKENPLYAVSSQVCHGKAMLRNMLNDTSGDIENWISVSNSFMNILATFLLPFLFRHNIDVRKFISFELSQIKDETARNSMQSQYEKWCENL